MRDLAELLLRNFTWAGYWMNWLERGVRVLIIILLAWAVTRIVRHLLTRLRHQAVNTMDKRGGATEVELEKRSVTITTALTKVVSTLVWLLAIVMSLNELAFNVQPLIAGLGIVGLALGLGAQSIVKDWLGGLFLLFEDQIRLGDSVSINNITGSVEEINLRTTVLRSENGAVHIVPNGLITQLSNFTREYSYYVFEVTVAHGAPVAKALSLLKTIGEELLTDEVFEPLILSPMEVMGVDKLTGNGVALRARLKTIPAQQATVGRELNRRVKERFDAEGIDFPGASSGALSQ